MEFSDAQIERMIEELHERCPHERATGRAFGELSSEDVRNYLLAFLSLIRPFSSQVNAFDAWPGMSQGAAQHQAGKIITEYEAAAKILTRLPASTVTDGLTAILLTPRRPPS